MDDHRGRIEAGLEGAFTARGQPLGRLALEPALVEVEALFRDNLDTASAWLDDYFDPTDGTAGSMRSAIAELRAVEIRPEVPDVSQSLRALRVRQELMEEIAPGGDETR